jgi:hypothetical protein
LAMAVIFLGVAIVKTYSRKAPKMAARAPG